MCWTHLSAPSAAGGWSWPSGSASPVRRAARDAGFIHQIYSGALLLAATCRLLPPAVEESEQKLRGLHIPILRVQRAAFRTCIENHIGNHMVIARDGDAEFTFRSYGKQRARLIVRFSGAFMAFMLLIPAECGHSSGVSNPPIWLFRHARKDSEGSANALLTACLTPCSRRPAGRADTEPAALDLDEAQNEPVFQCSSAVLSPSGPPKRVW